MSKTRFLSLVCASLLASGGALAAPCTGTYPATEPLATTDVTLSGQASDACHGVIDGNVNAPSDANAALAGTALGAGWSSSFINSSGSLSTDWLGLRFTLAVSGSGTTLGSYTLTVSDLPGLPDLPTYVDLLVAVKAGRQWAAYLFDEELINIDAKTGTWSVKFDNDPNPPFAALSHLGLFIRTGQTPTEVCLTCPRTVPEPSPLLLLGVLLVAPWLRRRRV